MPRKITIKRYRAGSGGWGSLRSLAKILWREKVPPVATIDTLMHQNKTGGFMCVSCAWPKPAEPHPFEFCENGAKATAWETTSLRCGPEFFARHTLAELRDWPDHDLEQQGRLTHPLRYDRAQDKYVAATWDDAIAAIGAELKALRELDRKSVVFYASGRASLETSYAWALLARMYGNNNLPDSSNMCHESTSVGLKQSLGVGVGTCILEDFRLTDCILLFGQNAPTNSPRFLHDLQQAARRGVPILVFNPLREGGLEKFRNPQHPLEMLTGHSTQIASHWYQVRAGGDIAAITGIAKAVLALDDDAQRTGAARVLDLPFIREHTHGFGDYESHVRATTWGAIENESGLSRA
ncbi:MAG TPA: molybdopterin-dependent oxidoreductase, partial [Xanthomonadales bacterium]|nr:molybdopterin-dependent oxidoreductase [Xanthomonadales bacterium]